VNNVPTMDTDLIFQGRNPDGSFRIQEQKSAQNEARFKEILKKKEERANQENKEFEESEQKQNLIESQK